MKKIKSGLGTNILNSISDYYQKPTPETNVKTGQETDESVNKNFNDLIGASIARRVHTRAMETEITKQFLPEIGIISQLITTNVLSPQDMITVIVNADSTSNLIPSTIKSLMNDIIKREVLNTYKIDTLCDRILDKCLFGSGSVPVLILPPSTIKKITSDLISSESAKSNNQKSKALEFENFGIFKSSGSSDKFSAEDSSNSVIDLKNLEKYVDKKDSLTMFDFVDDISYCAHNDVNNTIREARKTKKYLDSFSNEDSDSNKIYKQVLESMNSKKPKGFKQTTILKRPSKNNIEEETESAIQIELSSESVIPITANGSKDSNLGYIILYHNGHPLNIAKDVETYMHTVSNGSLNANSAHSEMIVSMGNALTNSNFSDSGSLERLRDSYGAFIESKLNENIKEGILGKDATIVIDDSIKLAMFSRALQSKRTTIVYVPSELLTYFCFDRDDYGIGRSLVDKSSVIAGMRAALNYADGLRAIKNTIVSTTLDIQLDPKDPRPQESVEDIVHAYLGLNRPFIPSAGNLMDNLDAAHAAAINVNVSGNPRYPETKTSVSTSNPQNQMADEETHNRFQKQHLLYFGITPEQIDTSIDIERAAQITTNNLMFYKRVRKISRVLEEMMSDHIRKLSLYDGPTIKALSECLKSTDLNSEINKTTSELIKYYDTTPSAENSNFIIIHEYIKTLEFVLPDPSGTSDKSLSDGFDELSEHLDKVLDTVLSSDIIDESSSGELTSSINTAKARIKSYYLRRYCIENEFLSNVISAFEMDEEGELYSDISELIARNTESSNEIIISLLSAIKSVKESLDSKMAKLHLNDTDQSDSSESVSDDTEASIDDTDVEDDTTTDDVVNEPDDDTTESEDDDELDPENAEQDKLKGYLDAGVGTADKEKDSTEPEDAENDKLNKYLNEK